MPNPADAAALAPAPASPWRRRGGFIAGVLVLGFLGWALIDGWSSVAEYDWNVSVGVLVLGCVVLLAFYLASALGWVGIIDRLHSPAPPGRVIISIWARSLLGRYVPGNVLMVLGRVVLNYERGIPRLTTLAGTVYEQLLTLGLAAAGAVVFVAVYDGGGMRIWLVALVPLALLTLHPRIFGPLSTRVLRAVNREPLPRLIPTGPLAALLVWYAFAAGLLGLGIWLVVCSAVGTEAGGPWFVGLAFLLSFAVSMLAFIFPSGLGVREGAFALALAQNLPGSVAVALSVGTRVMLTTVELVFIALAALAGRNR